MAWAHAVPLSPGRRWSSLAGLLLRMSDHIPCPRGCSETSHIGYNPLTGWHRWRGGCLPVFLTSCFRACAGRPCERQLQGRCSDGADSFFALGERARLPPRASRRDTVWRGGVPQHTRTRMHTHAHTDAHTHTHVHARTHIHTRGVERCIKHFTGLQA